MPASGEGSEFGLSEDPLRTPDYKPSLEVKRTIFELMPLRRALEYVVSEAKKSDASSHFMAVGRVAQAALTWQKLDEAGNFEEAQKWLDRIPMLKGEK